MSQDDEVLADRLLARREIGRASVVSAVADSGGGLLSHREKVKYLIKDLSERGVNPYTVAPPAWRLAWSLGFSILPPHFMGIFPLATTTGGFFGVLWGAAMWFLVWRSMPLVFAIGMGLASGSLFGLSMATYYRWSASKLNLPSWENYPET